jgi:hypothetical protein
MQTVSMGRQRTTLERACVLYERDSGAIRHIQHVIVMEGGYAPNEREVEAMARRALTKRGRPHDRLDVLHVERALLGRFAVYRVDPQRKLLVEQRR